jgi:transcriptional regulator with XRE-family HTH domain
MENQEKEIFLTKIGERLKFFRIKKGYTNHETFANDLDMTRSQYWEYEKGKKNITIFTLNKILLKLNISLSEFFHEDIE